MATIHPLVNEKARLREVDTPAPEPVRTARGRISGILFFLLVTVIAVASWFFFSNLFNQRASVTATPVAKVKIGEDIFVPAAAQTPPPVIRLPTLGAANEPDTKAPVIDAAKEPQPDAIEATTAPPPVVATNITPDIKREPRKTPRSSVVAIAKPAPLPRAIEKARLPTADVDVESTTPVVGNPSPHLDISTISVMPRSAPTRDSGTEIARYTTPSFVPDITPIEFETKNIPAPPLPNTVSKKPVQRKSGLVIIVNKANFENMARTDISNIYRDRITRWPSGERILVMNLPFKSGERQRFSTEILEMSPLDAATESSNRAITNRVQNESRTKNSDVVVSYIARHPNAIGYVPASAVENNDNVRVVYTLP